MNSITEIENTRKRFYHYLDILNRIHRHSHAISREYNSRTVLTSILETCCVGMNSKKAVVYYYNPKTRLLECIRTYGFDSKTEQLLFKKTFTPLKTTALLLTSLSRAALKCAK